MMEDRYPTYKLSNGLVVKFICLNKEGFELYKDLKTGLNNIVREDTGLWSYTNGEQWGSRKTPMFGVTILN